MKYVVAISVVVLLLLSTLSVFRCGKKKEKENVLALIKEAHKMRDHLWSLVDQLIDLFVGARDQVDMLGRLAPSNVVTPFSELLEDIPKFINRLRGASGVLSELKARTVFVGDFYGNKQELSTRLEIIASIVKDTAVFLDQTRMYRRRLIELGNVTRVYQGKKDQAHRFASALSLLCERAARTLVSSSVVERALTEKNSFYSALSQGVLDWDFFILRFSLIIENLEELIGDMTRASAPTTEDLFARAHRAIENAAVAVGHIGNATKRKNFEIRVGVLRERLAFLSVSRTIVEKNTDVCDLVRQAHELIFSVFSNNK